MLCLQDDVLGFRPVGTKETTFYLPEIRATTNALLHPRRTGSVLSLAQLLAELQRMVLNHILTHCVLERRRPGLRPKVQAGIAAEPVLLFTADVAVSGTWALL